MTFNNIISNFFVLLNNKYNIPLDKLDKYRDYSFSNVEQRFEFKKESVFQDFNKNKYILLDKQNKDIYNALLIHPLVSS